MSLDREFHHVSPQGKWTKTMIEILRRLHQEKTPSCSLHEHPFSAKKTWWIQENFLSEHIPNYKIHILVFHDENEVWCMSKICKMYILFFVWNPVKVAKRLRNPKKQTNKQKVDTAGFPAFLTTWLAGESPSQFPQLPGEAPSPRVIPPLQLTMRCFFFHFFFLGKLWIFFHFFSWEILSKRNSLSVHVTLS